MSAKRVVKAPALDAKAFVEHLAKAFPTVSGTARPVYTTPFPRFVQWLRADGEFEGKGVADAVNAHAVNLDDHKRDIDEHSQRLAEAEARIAALEARPSAPFPASSSGGV